MSSENESETILLRWNRLTIEKFSFSLYFNLYFILFTITTHCTTLSLNFIIVVIHTQNLSCLSSHFFYLLNRNSFFLARDSREFNKFSFALFFFFSCFASTWGFNSFVLSSHLSHSNTEKWFFFTSSVMRETITRNDSFVPEFQFSQTADLFNFLSGKWREFEILCSLHLSHCEGLLVCNIDATIKLFLTIFATFAMSRSKVFQFFFSRLWFSVLVVWQIHDNDKRRCAPPNRYFSASENIPQLPTHNSSTEAVEARDE